MSQAEQTFRKLDEHVQARSAGIDDPVEADPGILALGLWTAARGITSLLIALPDFPWPRTGR